MHHVAVCSELGLGGWLWPSVVRERQRAPSGSGVDLTRPLGTQVPLCQVEIEVTVVLWTLCMYCMYACITIMDNLHLHTGRGDYPWDSRACIGCSGPLDTGHIDCRAYTNITEPTLSF